MSNGIKSSMAVELSENELDIVAGGCSCDTGYKQTKETETHNIHETRSCTLSENVIF